jgi:8-oxo-dGTP pyrophosphatase MutT (NUDIX family)
MNKSFLCNNCSKIGHLLHQCKLPIISCGIILTQIVEGQLYFLMIRRKDSFGYIDFIRGKYNVNNIYQVQKKINEMSIVEKDNLLKYSFDDLWKNMWGKTTVNSLYKNEANHSSIKFELLTNGVLFNGETYCLNDLIKNSTTNWKETEWEFPKGRKNYQEKDIDCALRECVEETGIEQENIHLIDNIIPYEELFIGSNHKFYKHKYFIAVYKPENNDITNLSTDHFQFQRTEVSKLEWKTFDECIQSIRPYHLEKKIVLQKINDSMKSLLLYE